MMEEKQILLCRIKLLENLLQEHKIPFPSLHDLSFDNIMSELCSFYNKSKKNTKMYYIENTDTEYEIIDEEEEEEEDEAPPPQPQKPVPEINENLLETNREKFDEIFKTLATIRTPKKLLADYLKLKLETMKVMNIHTYIEMLLQHCKIIFDICEQKNCTKKRIQEIMSLSYSPLDLRLLSYQMKRSKFDKNLPSNVGLTEMKVDDINDLKESLHLSKYKGNNKEKIISNFLNYRTAVITLKQSAEFYLVENPCIIYLVDKKKDDIDDPYRFYYLKKEMKNKTCWEMDCRLDNIVSLFIKNISVYLVQLFRSIYHDVFHDNLFRQDFSSKAIIFDNDCEQLLQNVCLLSNYKATSSLLKNVIITNCSHIETENDVFCLRSDDKLLKKELETREKEIDYDILENLFDDITFDEAKQLYSKYFSK